MTSLLKRSFPHALLVVSVLLASGCAIQLAPPYDKAVVEELTSANTETMKLLAEVAGGTDKGSFAKRDSQYVALIGRLDALAVLAGARPMPKNKVTDAINKALEKRGGKPLEDDDSTPPSAHAIGRISATLTKMRETDRKQGITAIEAQAFKGQAVIYFDQAITYENFLQR